jgi:hypothetical protein
MAYCLQLTLGACGVMGVTDCDALVNTLAGGNSNCFCCVAWTVCFVVDSCCIRVWAVNQVRSDAVGGISVPSASILGDGESV